MKMYVHDSIDRNARNAITAFTTMLALTIIAMTVRSWLTIMAWRSQRCLHLAPQSLGDLGGAEAFRGEARRGDARLHDDLVLAADVLREDAAHLAERFEAHTHGERVVEPRGL